MEKYCCDVRINNWEREMGLEKILAPTSPKSLHNDDYYLPFFHKCCEIWKVNIFLYGNMESDVGAMIISEPISLPLRY